MKLLTKTLAASLSPLYSTENDPDPIARVKFFTPDSSWTWAATEYDPETRTFFGLVIGHEAELGYFTLEQLEEVRGPLGLKVERDLYFTPKHLSQIR
jgi:hypothetical protein